MDSAPSGPGTHGDVYLHDPPTTGTDTRLTDPHSKGVLSVAFSPVGNTLAICDHNGTTYLWDLTTRKIRADLSVQHGL